MLDVVRMRWIQALVLAVGLCNALVHSPRGRSLRAPHAFVAWNDLTSFKRQHHSRSADHAPAPYPRLGRLRNHAHVCPVEEAVFRRGSQEQSEEVRTGREGLCRHPRISRQFGHI